MKVSAESYLVVSLTFFQVHVVYTYQWPCDLPIDIRDRGVKTEKIQGSRVEYDPFPGGFRITSGQRISVEFRTRNGTGLIFLVGNFKEGDRVAAYLNGGRLVFARRCGSTRAFETYRQRMDDGRWHKITYMHTTKGGTLLIDGVSPFRSYYMGPCSDFYSVLFGGLSPYLQGNDVTHRFEGCIRKMRIDNKIPKVHPKYHAVSQCD